MQKSAGVDMQLEWPEAFIEEAVGTLFSWCERFRCYNHMIYGIVSRSKSVVILRSNSRRQMGAYGIFEPAT
ncbi:hypothetical protein Tco_0720253 [Tanacetum coccineum]